MMLQVIMDGSCIMLQPLWLACSDFPGHNTPKTINIGDCHAHILQTGLTQCLKHGVLHYADQIADQAWLTDLAGTC